MSTAMCLVLVVRTRARSARAAEPPRRLPTSRQNIQQILAWSERLQCHATSMHFFRAWAHHGEATSMLTVHRAAETRKCRR